MLLLVPNLDPSSQTLISTLLFITLTPHSTPTPTYVHRRDWGKAQYVEISDEIYSTESQQWFYNLAKSAESEDWFDDTKVKYGKIW